jgi:hypothetical protein
LTRLRDFSDSFKAKFTKYGLAPVLWARNPTNGQISKGYYEDVRMIFQGSRSESGTLMGAGLGQVSGKFHRV